jgi:hypothetical protein
MPAAPNRVGSVVNALHWMSAFLLAIALQDTPDTHVESLPMNAEVAHALATVNASTKATPTLVSASLAGRATTVMKLSTTVAARLA